MSWKTPRQETRFYENQYLNFVCGGVTQPVWTQFPLHFNTVLAAGAQLEKLSYVANKTIW